MNDIQWPCATSARVARRRVAAANDFIFDILTGNLDELIEKDDLGDMLCCRTASVSFFSCS